MGGILLVYVAAHITNRDWSPAQDSGTQYHST